MTCVNGTADPVLDLPIGIIDVNPTKTPGDVTVPRVRTLLAVLGVAAALVAGCDDPGGTGQADSSTSPSAAASPSASPTSSAADPAVPANTKQVCGELKKVMEDQAAAVETARRSFSTWATAVRALSAKATDSALRKGIDDQATALDTTAASLTVDQLTTAMASPSMSAAGRQTKQVCGW